jgi:hypothetical protein
MPQHLFEIMHVSRTTISLERAEKELKTHVFTLHETTASLSLAGSTICVIEFIIGIPKTNLHVASKA